MSLAPVVCPFAGVDGGGIFSCPTYRFSNIIGSMAANPILSLDQECARNVAARIIAGRLIAKNGCWLWQNSLDRDGYGRFRVTVNGERRCTGAHRASYLSLKGAIPAGLLLDHLCRNRACVNPDHLEPVTTSENNRRSDLIGRNSGGYARDKTECKHGHPFTPENTFVYARPDGYVARICIQCRRRRSRAFKARVRAAA